MKLSTLNIMLFVGGLTLSTVAHGSELIKVKSARVFKTPENNPMVMPTDVALGPGGEIYVSDGVNHRIIKFNSQGKFLSSIGKKGSAKGYLKSPLGIDVGKNGHIYVADTGNKRVQVFSAEGKFVKLIPAPGKIKKTESDITDVAVDKSSQRVFLCDNDNHQIHVFDEAKNSYAKSWGELGKDILKFQYPFFISFTPDGNLMVTETINTRVQVINPKGKFISFIGKMGVEAGELYRPKSSAMLDNKVFITDSYLGRIQAFSITGKYLGLLTDSSGKPMVFDTPTGITSDPKNNRLYVIEFKAGQVRELTLSK